METRTIPAEKVRKGEITKLARGDMGLFIHISVVWDSEPPTHDVRVWIKDRFGNPQGWHETIPADPGEYVLLRGFSKNPKGWRAVEARLFRPEDEEHFWRHGEYAWAIPEKKRIFFLEWLERVKRTAIFITHTFRIHIF